MASGNQLTARVRDSSLEGIQEYAADEEIDETDAERRLVRIGLEETGYVEAPPDPGEAYLSLARRSGSILGFAGLACIGYGLFASMVFRWIGFGLVLAGLAVIGGSEFAPGVKARLSNQGDAT